VTKKLQTQKSTP